MAFLTTKEEKESFALSSGIMILIVLICFFFGLTSLDPPPENGIAINFGTSDTGKGDIQPLEPVAAQQQQSQPESAPDDAILTQDDDSPVTVTPNKDKPKETKPKENKPKETPKKPSEQSNNALNNILNSNANSGSNPASHGDDEGGGDKGDPKGSLYANSFYGSGTGNGTGAGNGTGWGLKGRKLSGNNKKVQDCNEEGKVVVKIWVNREGNVFRAERSQGTTNTNPCLVNPALETARTFKWQPDPNAPETQIGFVVVNFQLGE